MGSVRLFCDVGFVLMELFVVRFFVVAFFMAFAGTGQRLTGKHLHWGAIRGGQ